MSFYQRLKSKVKESIEYLEAPPTKLTQEEESQFQKERTELLRELKASISTIVETLSNEQTETSSTAENVGITRVLDMNDLVVRDLLVWLERSLWHGMKHINRLSKTTPTGSPLTLWNFVQNVRFLPSLEPEPGLVQAMKSVMKLPGIKTDTGRSRAWLRSALNEKVLDKTLAVLVKDVEVLNAHYESFALLRDEEACSLLFAILLALTGLSFGFKLTEEVDFDGAEEPMRRPIVFSSKQGPSRMWPALRLHKKSQEVQLPEDNKNWLYQSLMRHKLHIEGEKKARLLDLVTDSSTCVCAKMQWKVGIPDILARCLALLWANPNLGNALLFSNDPLVATPESACFELVDALGRLAGNDLFILYRVGVDVEMDVAANSIVASSIAGLGGSGRLTNTAEDPYTLARIIKQGLTQIRDPLVSEDVQDALMACLDLEDKEARLRNVACLMESLPDENKPVLNLLLTLLQRIATFANADDDASVRATNLSKSLQPFLLPLEDHAKASLACTFLINNAQEVMKNCLTNIEQLKFSLSTKVDRLRERSAGLAGGLNVNDKLVLDSFETLWRELTPRSESDSVKDNFSLESIGWKARGFTSSRAVDDFRGGGLTALQDLCYFVVKHGAKARQMCQGTCKYPFVQTGVQMTRLTTNMLGLSGHEFSDAGESKNRDRIAAQPWWHMLGETDATQRVYCMLFLLFDMNFTEQQATLKEFYQIKQQTKMQMQSLLTQGPQKVDELWHAWIQLRAQQHLANTPSVPSPVKRVTALQNEVTSDNELTQNEESDDTKSEYEEQVVVKDTSNVQVEDVTEGDKSLPREGSAVSQVNPDLVPYLPTLLGSSNIITQNHVAKLEASLPASYQGYDWSLVFSTVRNGENLELLYQLAKGHQASLLLIKDVNGVVFGGFATDEWRIEPQYYGTGESFIFTFLDGYKAYPWTQKSSYFMLASEDSLAMGGGGEGFGFYLDEDLSAGTSAPCETYGNERLTPEEDFDCSFIEIWSFQLKTER